MFQICSHFEHFLPLLKLSNKVKETMQLGHVLYNNGPFLNANGDV